MEHRAPQWWTDLGLPVEDFARLTEQLAANREGLSLGQTEPDYQAEL